MTIKEFYEKYGHHIPNVEMETIITSLVKQGKVKFQPIMEGYVKYLERLKEYNKCRLTECASLLHLTRDKIPMPGMDARITHMLKNHSNMALTEKELEGYDPEQAEKNFLDIYNLD